MRTEYPSGGLFIAVSMPIVPPAPVRFSITTCWPSSRDICSPITRATKSSPPPAASGTMNRTGRFGQSCAAAALAKTTAPTKPANNLTALIGPSHDRSILTICQTPLSPSGDAAWYPLSYPEWTRTTSGLSGLCRRHHDLDQILAFERDAEARAHGGIAPVDPFVPGAVHLRLLRHTGPVCDQIRSFALSQGTLCTSLPASVCLLGIFL